MIVGLIVFALLLIVAGACGAGTRRRAHEAVAFDVSVNVGAVVAGPPPTIPSVLDGSASGPRRPPGTDKTLANGPRTGQNLQPLAGAP
ncbi:MAG: hypothetical protein OXI73_14450 [Rhodospirillales bacterium]|nr:hypothetical protein [Rhodospirillales bacterium]